LVTREEIESIRNVDDARAFIERDPLAAMFAIWDAENADAKEDADAYALADAECQAQLGLPLTLRVLLEFAEREGIDHLWPSLPPLAARLLYAHKPWLDFRRYWPHTYLVEPANPLLWQWQPAEGALCAQWQFKVDPRQVLAEFPRHKFAPWQHVTNDAEALSLYGRSPGKDYWKRLAAVIDATVDPFATLRSLIGPSPGFEVALAA
jgi:hypothetical protein